MRLTARYRAWLELLRVPNLLTVPGDPLAGYLLSGAGWLYGPGKILPVLLSSISFYCFGLILNDLADAVTDGRERPSRPVPSGRISVQSCKAALVFFLLGGLALAWMTGVAAGAAGSLLAFAITAYNLYFKKYAFAGPVSMGLCRGLSLIMGAAAGGGMNVPAGIAATILVLYVAAFSSIARLEMGGARVGAGRWNPALVLMIMFPVLYYFGPGREADAWIVIKTSVPAVLAAVLALMCGRRLNDTGDIPGVIGGFIANIMIVQAALCSMAGPAGSTAAAVIACMVPAFVLLSLKFYSS